MRLAKAIFHLSFFTSHLYAYPDTQDIPTSYVYTASNPTSQDSLPYNPTRYDYLGSVISSRDDSYSGIDSYGVPVEEPLLTTPPPDPLPQDYYSYPTATGTGYGAPR